MLSPKDIQSIQHCINDLAYVLKNWEYFADFDPSICIITGVDTTSGVFDVDAGLCGNVFDPNNLSDHIKLCMFIAWDGFSGDAVYPVGGMDEYDCEEFKNLYCNGSRKALALHCVKYLSYLLEL